MSRAHCDRSGQASNPGTSNPAPAPAPLRLAQKKQRRKFVCVRTCAGTARFFSFKGQTYFACNDRSHGGGGGFRSTIIAYVHYRTNGADPSLPTDARPRLALEYPEKARVLHMCEADDWEMTGK